MSLIVSDIVGQGGLQGARVIAGNNGMNRTVNSISVLEVGEEKVARWVLKDQVYLTAFYAIRQDVQMQKVVISTLADSGCSGLIICHLGIWIHEISEEVVNLCNDLDFPLIIAKPEVSYLSIMEPILKHLILEDTEKGQTTRQVTGIRSDILDLIITESDSHTIFRKISQQYGIRITYLDIYYDCVYSDKPSAQVTQELTFIREHIGQLYKHCAYGQPYIWETPSGKKTISIIKAARNFFGFLILDLDKTTEGEQDYLNEIISSISVTCSIIFSRKDRLEEMQEHYLMEYITDLLVWNFPSVETARRRGLEVGLDIGNKHSIMVVNINLQQISEMEGMLDIRSHIKEAYLPQCSEIIHFSDKRSDMVYRSDTIVIFFENLNNDLDLLKIGQNICLLFEQEKQFSVSVGISDYFDEPQCIPAAYAQAFNSALLCRDIWGANRAAAFQEMWLLQYLQRLTQDRTARAMCERMLKPLVEHDRQHQVNLLETLSVLISCNMDMAEATTRLFVHRNTLLYRKNKIIELLGFSPFEPPHLFNMFVALFIMGGGQSSPAWEDVPASESPARDAAE